MHYAKIKIWTILNTTLSNHQWGFFFFNHRVILDSTYEWLMAWIKFLLWLKKTRPHQSKVLLIDNQIEREPIFKINKQPQSFLASNQRIPANHNCRILASLPTRKGKQPFPFLPFAVFPAKKGFLPLLSSLDHQYFQEGVILTRESPLKTEEILT